MNCLTKITFLFLCNVLLPVWLCAQESGVIRGIIVEAGSSKRLSGVTVTNKNTQRTAISNNLGTFEIYVTVGDSLTASSVGYVPVATEITTLSDILLDMKMGTIQLETATVDRMSKEAELRDAMQGYRKQGVYYNGKPPALAYIFNPVTSLYELFGRTPRNARRFQNYMSQELAATEVDRKFNKALIQDLTGLEGEDLNNFIVWFRPSYEKIQHWQEYDMTAYIMQSFKQFERDGRPAPPKLPELKADPPED
ncbi:carboxypeptidase-like regulatory domain-containing protein [Parapedobacter lycopersici]|uniref:carboxypeptidase-like regulatory domain-containing protein n=1 Tax=Parapedobacter lycopersici TaxID=1864939 RepID=UPI00214DBE9F|nr:carboxypeptidase-like regulatory domain-containing protein [Parapedobacter lycopersici]